MTIEQCKDVESGEAINGLRDLEVPLVQSVKDYIESDSDHDNVENGSIGMVLFCTFVAVCGSFAFGTCEPNQKSQHTNNQKGL